MDLSKVIDNLINQNGGACVLDKLHVPYEHDAAGPAAKFGLGCELYLENIDREVMRGMSLEFFGSFQKMFPNRIDDFLPTDQRRTVKIKGDVTIQIRADMEKSPANKGYSTSLFGAVNIGLPKDDIEPYQAHLLIGRENLKRLSFASAFMPICSDKGKDNFAKLLEATREWCSIFKPVHGGAGLSLIFASGMSQNSVYALQIMKRFPGLGFIDGVTFSRESELEHDRIKCVNWLTVLGDKLIDKLGGLEKIKISLEPLCQIHTFKGGAIIQAGEAPELGDLGRNQVPEAYRAVAKFTAPVRFENYKFNLFRVPDGMDRKAETLSWIRRFD